MEQRWWQHCYIPIWSFCLPLHVITTGIWQETSWSMRGKGGARAQDQVEVISMPNKTCSQFTPMIRKQSPHICTTVDCSCLEELKPASSKQKSKNQSTNAVWYILKLVYAVHLLQITLVWKLHEWLFWPGIGLLLVLILTYKTRPISSIPGYKEFTHNQNQPKLYLERPAMCITVIWWKVIMI